MKDNWFLRQEKSAEKSNMLHVGHFLLKILGPGYKWSQPCSWSSTWTPSLRDTISLLLSWQELYMSKLMCLWWVFCTTDVQHLIINIRQRNINGKYINITRYTTQMKWKTKFTGRTEIRYQHIRRLTRLNVRKTDMEEKNYAVKLMNKKTSHQSNKAN